MMSKRKRVLVLLPYFDLGGAEKQGLYIAKSMHESGLYEVEVWAFAKSTGLLMLPLQEAGIPHKTLNIFVGEFQRRIYRLRIYIMLWWKLLKGKFDYIIPYTYHSNVLAATLFRFAGVKKCIWLQIAMEYHMPVTLFEKIARFFKPTYAANSYAAAQYIAARHGIHSHDVRFIPNPFEVKTAKNSVDHWKAKLQKHDGHLVMVMAANFFPEKDHATVIKALAQLGEYYNHLKIVFAGGPLNSAQTYYLKSLVLDLNLNDQIIFTGPVDDIPGLLSVADFGLLASKSEGSPNSVIEYMGYKLPVIATSIPPIVELLGSNYPYLFEAGNVEDCVRCIKKIVKEKDNTAGLVETNFNTVMQTYSVANNYNEFHSLIQA